MAFRNFFVRGLPWTVNAQKLEAYLSKFGKVNSAKVAFDKNTGLSKGYGFVAFEPNSEFDASSKKHYIEGNFINFEPSKNH